MNKNVLYISCCGKLSLKMLSAAFSLLKADGDLCEVCTEERILLADAIGQAEGENELSVKALSLLKDCGLSTIKREDFYLMIELSKSLSAYASLYLPGFRPRGIADPLTLLMAQKKDLPLGDAYFLDLPDCYAAALLLSMERLSLLPSCTICKTVGSEDKVTLTVLKKEEQSGHDEIWKLETNLDDCSGEILGYCLIKLMDAGALDVSYRPIFMKKNRPAWELVVICREDNRKRLEEIIFRETTTIGIRRMRMERSVLRRYPLTLKTAAGEALVKACEGEGFIHFYPEYDSAVKLAKESGLSLKEIYRLIEQAAQSLKNQLNS